MAGYNYGKNAVFGSGNTTSDLTGSTVVVGDSNTVSGSAQNVLVVGESNTVQESLSDSAIVSKGSTLESGSDNSVIMGGTGSVMQGGSDSAAIIGGLRNNLTAAGSMTRGAVIGGLLNNNSGIGSVILGGGLNVIGDAADNAFIMGSGNNIGVGGSKAWCLGTSNTVGDTNARTAFMSWEGTAGAEGNYSIAFGYQPETNDHMSFTYGGGKLGGVAGSVQFHHKLIACQTTDATQTTMVTQRSSHNDSIRVKLNSSYMFRIEIVARRTSTQTESAAYEILGCVKNDAGTTALEGTITKTVIAEADAAWDVTAVANNTDDTLDVKVTGQAGNNINWVAKVTLVETNGA